MSASMTETASVDADSFRTVMGAVCSQVVIVTTLADEIPHGTTVTAFASLSLDPPLVSVALAVGSRLLDQMRIQGRVGINLLAQGQEELAMHCARKGPDRFGTIPWSVSEDLPRIDGAVGWLACEVQDEILLGDHVLVVARVIASVVPDAHRAPLVYAGRSFGTHSDWLEREPGAAHPFWYEPLDRLVSWTN